MNNVGVCFGSSYGSAVAFPILEKKCQVSSIEFVKVCTPMALCEQQKMMRFWGKYSNS